MNFYSEDIVCGIMKTERGINAVADFYENVFALFCKYSSAIVSPQYIFSLLSDKTNSIAFRCIDMEFNIHNCPSILIYRKHYDVTKNENVYYILMICTKQKFKNLGYASNLLDDFIEYIRGNVASDPNQLRRKIVLSSIESAVTFYEQYGFKWMRTSLNEHATLMNYELYEEGKEYFILELYII